MNRYSRYFTIALGVLGLLSSCNKLDESFDLASKDTVGEMMLYMPTISRSTSVNDFVVEIREGMDVVKHYDTYSQMPEIVTLPVGSYTVEAYSDNLADAAWEAPYYHGSVDFAILAGKLTKVKTLECKLSNIRVSVSYSEKLQALLGDDINVEITIGNGTLSFAKTEARAGYFKSIDQTNLLVAKLTGTIDGQQVEVTQTYNDVKAGEGRNIKYDLKEISDEEDYESGIVVLDGASFVVDGSCNKVDLGEIGLEVPEDSLNDKEEVWPVEPDGGGGDPDPQPQTPPTIVGDGFDIKQQIPGTTPVVKVNIAALNGIQDLQVQIVSEKLDPGTLAGAGLTDQFSLVNPGEYEKGLVGLGFPVKDQVAGKTELVFDISKFMELLGMFQCEHHFILTVTDTKGLVTQETLKILVE